MNVLKTVGKKYSDDLLFLVRFWRANQMDTLLYHEATGEDLWMAAELTQGHLTTTTWWMK